MASLQPQSEGYCNRPRLQKLLAKNKYFDLKLISLTAYREDDSIQRNQEQQKSGGAIQNDDDDEFEDEEDDEDNNVDLDDFDDIPQNISGELQGGCDDLDMDDLDALAN